MVIKMASKFTDNFNLDLYQDNEPANLKDQYNDAMQKLDKDLLSINDKANSAQNKANNLKTDLEAVKTNINDIKNNINNEINNLKTNIDNDINSVKNQLNEKTNKRGKLIWIGDSWSEGNLSQNEFIPNTVAEGLNCNLYNYAIGGSGLLVGTTFSTQLTNAINDPQFDNDEITYVVIFGGINDRNSNVDTSAINETLNKAVNNFKNAKIYCIPMQKAQNANDWGKTYDWVNAYLRNGVPKAIIIPGAWYWDIGHQEDFNNSNPGHPNALGVKVFANKILCGINGSVQGNTKQFNVSLNKNLSNDSYLKFTINGDGTYTVFGMVKFTVDVTYDYIGQLFNNFYINTTANRNIYPNLAQYNGSSNAYIMIEPDPYNPTDPKAEYLGPQLCLKMYNIKQNEAYWINQTFQILQPN